MLYKHGAFYLKARVDGRQKWTRLGDEFSAALRAYAELVGQRPETIRTVAQAITHYVTIRGKNLKPDTLAGYAQSARRLTPVFGDMPLADLHREHVYRYLIERGNVAANRDRALLSATYTHLLNTGLYRGKNPCIELQFRNPETPRKRYITDAEFASMIGCLPRGLALMARWSYLTGMRQSDMLALRLTAASDAGVTYTPSKARRGKEPAPTLIAWTDALRAVWREAAGIRIGAQPLFRNRDGAHYTRDSFQSLWQRWRKKVAIPDLRWHDIRRKTGSDSETDQAASDRLGHADAAVTRRHYRAKPKVVKPLR